MLFLTGWISDAHPVIEAVEVEGQEGHGDVQGHEGHGQKLLQNLFFSFAFHVLIFCQQRVPEPWPDTSLIFRMHTVKNV